MAERPKLFGAEYSVYVRIVRLALLEKGVPYELHPVDVFAEGGPAPEHRRRHPFGRIPVFEHAGFSLYETSAITRYIDEGFEGPALQPLDVRGRARCNQIISIADNYAYPHLVWGLYVEQVSKPRRGEVSDVARVASALAEARICMRAVEDLMSEGCWFAGPSVTLADLYMGPMVAYLMQAEEGGALLQAHPRLSAWWSRLSVRPSMLRTSPDATAASG